MPQKVSDLENDAGYISEEKAGEMLAEYPKEERVEEIVKDAVAMVPPGKDGITPTITENPDNTQDDYRLDITSGDETFTTPNLMGKSEDGGVSSFNGRTGAVKPEQGDYTAEMVGAVTLQQVNAIVQAAILASWEESY